MNEPDTGHFFRPDDSEADWGMPSEPLLRRAGLDLWEWNIPLDRVEVSDHQGSLFNLSAGHFRGSTRSFLNRVYLEDRDSLAVQMRLAARGVEPASLTFRMRTVDGSLRTLTLSSKLIRGDNNIPDKMVGILHCVSARETSEDRLQQQQAALLQWAVSPAITRGNTREALRLVSAGAAQVLGVERVSFWFFEENDSLLRCALRYRLSAESYDGGDTLSCQDYPNYFEALTADKLIAATDARTSPDTTELGSHYLIPAGICTKLDILISRAARPVGLLSFEDTEQPREWRVDERGFAFSIAEMISTLLEISDRKEAETALSNQQQLLRDLINHSESLIFMKDLEGHYLLVNKRFEDLFGLSQEQLLEKTSYVLYPQEIVEQLDSNNRRVIDSGKVHTFEEQTVHNNRLRTWFSVKFPVRNSRGEIYAVAGMSTDITGRIQTEAALKESEMRHRALFRSSLDAMLTLDAADNITDCNPAACRLFDSDQLAGQPLSSLFPHSQPDHADEDWLSPERHRSSPTVECRCLRRNGSEFDAEISLTPMNLSGHTQRLLCVRDISARKQRDNLVLKIARGISTATGETFYRSLLAQLSQVLEADYAFVAQIDKHNPQILRTLAARTDGQEIANMEYDRNDTPCQEVLTRGTCVYPNEVQQRFPEDLMLQEMGVSAYVGASLTDSDDTPMGLLVVLFRKPLTDTELPRHLLQIFAVRASAEMQRQQHEVALVASEERYRAFINNSHEGIWRAELIPPVDIDQPVERQVDQILSNHVILEANQAIARMHNCSLEDLYGYSAEDFFGEGQFRKLLLEWINADYQLSDQEIMLSGRHGDQLWLSGAYTGVIENGRLVRIWGTRRDITEKKEYLSAIEYQAEHDALTHLPNRFWLSDRLKRLISSHGPDRKIALMLLDLDHFKEVNDSLGHHTGDQLLRQIGPRLATVLSDLGGDVARLGGDEFAIVLSEIDNADAAVQVGDQIARCLHQPFLVEGITLEVHCSIGISLFPDHGSEPSALLRCADVAMYLAKNANTSCALYNSELDEHSPRRLTLMSELGQAIRGDQLLLHYQPQLDLNTDKVVGFEALVRWQHPEQGMIPPGQFIHLAEMSDLIGPLTMRVLDIALAQWRRWYEQGHDYKVAVNLSTRNLMDDACPQQIRQMLAKHEAPPHCLELEITESALIADPARAMDSLREINDAGVTLSIDDFGTGYSSLAYLKQLPIHRLKIDMSFVRNMAHDPRDEMIVNSTINLAHNLGLSVVAEGVEDKQSLRVLTEMECDLVQGYYIGRPVPAREITPDPETDRG